MSFTSDIKKELTTISVNKKCCQLAQVAGFLRFAGSLTIGTGGLGIRITTDNPAVLRLFVTLIKDYFGTKGELSVENSVQPLSKGRTYGLDITAEMNSEGILRESGILGVREGQNYITETLRSDIIKKRCCKKAFLRGAFLAAGMATDPAKAYQLEIVCESEQLASEMRKLIANVGLKAKISKRRSKFVIYMKDAEQISDFLGIIGASNQLFKFENTRITKEMRNAANRALNCENANLQRAVNAAQKQIADIKTIEEKQGLESLSENLKQTALLRMEYPELSLAELSQMFDPPVAKSGLNHRLARLSEIAAALRE